MKKEFVFGMFAVVLFTFGSCQKELFPDSFHIGCDDGMALKLVNNKCAEAKYGEEKAIELDVDEDGQPDLKFYTYATDSLGDQDRRGSSVWSLDGNIEFGYEVKYEDLYSVTKSSSQCLKEIIYNARSHFYCPDCQNLGIKKSKFSYSTPVMLQEGNTLSREIKWSDKLQILSQLDQSRQYSKEKGNTMIYNNILAGIWDRKTEGYIPIRKQARFGKYQYGWIKIRVVDHRRIEIYEIGLQDQIHWTF